MSSQAPDNPPALKDPTSAHPIAAAWRPMLSDVVQCLARGDYELARCGPGVRRLAPETAEQIRGYLSEYGATLVELPSEAWNTSVAQWMDPHWEVVVDLWTAEEGRSDLVLAGDVIEVGDGVRLTVHGVYVP